MTHPFEDPGAATAVAEAPDPLPEHDRRPLLVTGAAGFVGAHVCRELARRGWRVRALVRDPARAARRLASYPVTMRTGDIRDRAAVRDAIAGAQGVVHLAAIAIERRGESYTSVNREATELLLDAAREAGVRRFVHMSQNGASPDSAFAFTRSKGEAEAAVTASDREWTVLRPSVIFGPEDEFVNVLGRLVRLSPGVLPLPDGGRARFQPVSVEDVARAVARVLDRPESAGMVYPIGGPSVLTLRQMAERILLAMGAHRAIVGTPRGALRPLVALLQRVLPHPPVTTSLLDLLALDNVVPDNAITSALGIEPVPFAPEELLWLRRITLGDALRSFFGDA